MNELTIALSLGLPLGGLLLWILLSGRHPTMHDPLPAELKAEALRPRHYRYFAQIRQALSSADEQYLRSVAPPGVAKQVLRERRAVALGYLQGLREDFRALEQLARMVAALSPVISREQEMQRLALILQFNLLFSLVRLRILTGRVPLQQMQRLTDLVGRLTVRMEESMSAIAALSARQISEVSS